MTSAFKFLEADSVGPFSRFPWPLPENGAPGSWVESPDGPALCRQGVHACRPDTLARWLAPTLWRVELDGEVAASGSVLVAARGRLVGRVDRWDDETARELMEDCVALARRLADEQPESRVLGELADEAPGYLDGTWSFDTVIDAVAMGTYVVGRAAGVAAAPDGDLEGHRTGFDAERRRQSLWLAERLGLPSA